MRRKLSTAAPPPKSEGAVKPATQRLTIMLRNWTYPEFRKILKKAAREERGHKEVSVFRHLYCYLRALELRSQGLPLNEIAATLTREAGWPSINTIKRWLRRAAMPTITTFDVRRPEVGFIIGAVLAEGDAYIEYRNEKNRIRGYRVDFYNASEDFLQEYIAAAKRLGLRPYRKPHLGIAKIRIDSALLWLLTRYYRDFILSTIESVQAEFLRGLFLGDGSLKNHEAITNCDVELVGVTERLLTKFGIDFSERREGPKGEYRVYVKANSWRKYLKLVGLAESPPRSLP